MPTIHFRFPGGRYHATPGGHHVNEGRIEWPPSPWRLLRAFIATGYTRSGWVEIPDIAGSLINKLASVLPLYRLPPAAVAHSRHYMPLGVLGKGREKTTLVFDAWADIGHGCVVVHWPVSLTDEETTMLAELAARLGYLGRSESWVDAQLVADDEPGPSGCVCVPCDTHDRPARDYEQVDVMAAVDPETYAAWRRNEVEDALSAFPLPEKKKPSKKLLKDRAKAAAPYPESLVEALQWDTAKWKGYHWGQPPGVRRVLYWRRMDALQVGMPVSRKRPEPDRVECMLLALATPSRNASALPTVRRALPQADLIHRALVARVGRGDPVDCPELTGKDAEGHPLEGHRHARILPLDLDGDGHLDHVLIHALMGLGGRAQEAVRSLRRTWQKKGVDLQVTLVGEGDRRALCGLPEHLQPGVTGLLGEAAGSRMWRSATPFVPPRFVKRRGKNTLEGQVLQELESLGYRPAEVRLVPWSVENAHLRHAVRVRSGSAKPPPVDCGYDVELRFEAPVFGPVSLGYASHYGLGLFRACDEED